MSWLLWFGNLRSPEVVGWPLAQRKLCQHDGIRLCQCDRTKLEYLWEFQTTGVPLALKRDAAGGFNLSMWKWSTLTKSILCLIRLLFTLGSRLMHMLRRWLGDEAFTVKRLNICLLNFSMEIPSVASLEYLRSCFWSWCSSLYGLLVEQPGYLFWRLQWKQFTLALSKTILYRRARKIRNTQVLPLNSNWKGLPDTLETEMLEIQIILPWLLKTKVPCASIRKIHCTISRTIRVSCPGRF